MKNEPLSGWPLVGLVTLLAVTVLLGGAAHAYRRQDTRARQQANAASASDARIAALEQQVAALRQSQSELAGQLPPEPLIGVIGAGANDWPRNRAMQDAARNVLAGGASWR